MRLAALLGTLACCGLVTALASPSPAAVLAIDGQANIFGAGHASPPAPGGESPGQSPPGYTFTAAPGQVLNFSSVTGIVTCCESNLGAYGTGPDGGPHASGDTDITSFGGVSGILHSSRTMFLVGVFLDANEPVDPAPARLDFSGGAIGDDFTVLSPEIGQTFFVGDGLSGTGSGLTQQFIVPPSATRLYLGFADAADFGAPSSAPGYYGDNAGQLSAIFSITDIGATATRRSTWGTLKTSYR